MSKRQIAISLPSTGVEEWEALREPLESGWLTQGPKVAEFEKQYAAMHGANHVRATTNCTTGLHLVLAAFGIGPGDEVIVPVFKWISTANVVLYCGATPVLADVDPMTFNFRSDDIAYPVTEKTRAVIVAHLLGLRADIDSIRQAVPQLISIVEDCACAAAATCEGKSAGTLGIAGVFSFHLRKSITTGEGGMVTTKDSSLAEICDQLRNRGASVSEEIWHCGQKPYLLPDFSHPGFNQRMSDLQSAVGHVPLTELCTFIAEREEGGSFYAGELSSLSWLRMPEFPENDQHAWQSFATIVDPTSAPAPRNVIVERLRKAGIATCPGPHAVHMLNYYRERFGYGSFDYPGEQASNDNSMAIPLHNRIMAYDYDYVISTLLSI